MVLVAVGAEVPASGAAGPASVPGAGAAGREEKEGRHYHRWRRRSRLSLAPPARKEAEQKRAPHSQRAGARGAAAEEVLRIPVLALVGLAPVVGKGARGRKAQDRIEHLIGRDHLLVTRLARIHRRLEKRARGRDREHAPRFQEGVGVVADVESGGVPGPVAGFHQRPVHLGKPVEHHRDLRPVGGAVGMREAVLQRVHRLAHAQVIGGQRSIDLSAQREVQAHRGAQRQIRASVRAQTIQRVGDAPAHERAAGRHRCRGAARLLLIRTAQAVLGLVVGVAVDEGEDAEVVLAVSLQVVVADADQQGRAGQVGHVGLGPELEIVDERALFAGGRPVARQRQREAGGAQRLRGDALVAAGGEVGLDGERVGGRGGGDCGGEDRPDLCRASCHSGVERGRQTRHSAADGLGVNRGAGTPTAPRREP